jgi:hypothetical protein
MTTNDKKEEIKLRMHKRNSWFWGLQTTAKGENQNHYKSVKLTYI